MALYRCGCGGGLNLDLSNPDIISNATMSGNSTRTVAVTQKPRFIIYTYTRNGNSSGYGGLTAIDVEKGTRSYSKYGNNGFITTKQDASVNEVTTITASSITVANPNSYEIRNFVLIYY